MKKEYFKLTTDIRTVCCSECDSKDYCNGCSVADIFKQIKVLSNQAENVTVAEEVNEGCYICKDKNNKSKEVFYDDGRGGFKIAEFCPKCGRQL